MDINEYHAHSALGSSSFKALKKSPLHYWNKYLRPDRELQEPTAAMRLGTAVHTAVLEPNVFIDRYVMVPEGVDKRSSAGKQFFADIEASGKEPVSAENYDLIMKISSAVHAHPEMAAIFSHPLIQVEQTMFADLAIDEFTIVLKSRPDIMIPPCHEYPYGLIIDLKTASDASPDGFGKSSWDLDYFFQAVIYPYVFQQKYKTDLPPTFRWFAQEKESPFANKTYEPFSALIEYGWSEIYRLAEIYIECMESGAWPGYGEETQELQLPGWAHKVINGDDGEGEVEVGYVE